MRVVRQEGATTLHDAFDPELGHQVTLVTSPAGPDTAEEARLAFRLRRMRHPNIVPVLDAGRQGNVAFVAAQCLVSEPLAAFLARAGGLPVFQGLALVLQLLSAIEHAQARRLVHATIDLEHVQVTPGGQPKLPAGGWSLSCDRQPNLEAAARIAQALLSGPCPPPTRAALDEVLLRAQGPDREARYRSADAFALALLRAAGIPVWNRPLAIAHAAPAEPQPEPAISVPVAQPAATHAPARPSKKPLHRPRTGRNLVAACLVAALLLPHLVTDSTFSGGNDAPGSAVTSPRQAPAAADAPAQVALAPVAVSPVEPSPVPVSPVVPPSVPVSPVVPPSVPASPAAPPSVQASPAAPSRSAPSIRRPVAPAARSIAPKPVARTATRQRTTRAQPAPPVRQARATPPATPRARAARARVATPVAVISGCPYEPQAARERCEMQQCMRLAPRQRPDCVRMLAEQRAALARLRGTPD